MHARLKHGKTGNVLCGYGLDLPLECGLIEELVGLVVHDPVSRNDPGPLHFHFQNGLDVS